jgi:hypothetical protein
LIALDVAVPVGVAIEEVGLGWAAKGVPKTPKTFDTTTADMRIEDFIIKETLVRIGEER